jgi:hypothetical protein
MLCSPAIVAMVQTIILGKLNDQTNVLELDSSRFRNDRARTFHISGPVKDVQIYNNVFFIGKELDIPVFFSSRIGKAGPRASLLWTNKISMKSYAHSADQCFEIARFQLPAGQRPLQRRQL